MGRSTHPSRKRRSVIDFGAAQIGDVTPRDVAGGNIYNGVSPEHIVALMHEVIGDQRQYRALELREREQRRETLDQELADLRAAVDRIAKDIGQYREIGVSADTAVLGGFREQFAAVARALAHHRLALIAMLLALLILGVIVGAHIAQLRPVAGGAAALLIASSPYRRPH